MDRAFDRTGVAVEIGSPASMLVLTEFAGRPALKAAHRDDNGCSIYSFGTIACSGIKAGFDWSALLEAVPDPATAEKRELKRKLLAQEEDSQRFYIDEIASEPIPEDRFEQVAELFARLFPAQGHFLDSYNFISDNFYSFDPTWGFRGYQTAPDFRTMVKEAFGVYRKDLARAVAKSSGSAIALLSHFRDSITVEQMITFLERGDEGGLNGWGHMGSNFEEAIADLSGFQKLSGTLRFRLIGDLLDRIFEEDQDNGFAALRLVGDTLTMLASIPERDFKRFRSDRDWDEIHGRAITLASAEDTSDLESIDFPAKILRLDGEEIGHGISMKLLRTPLEFLQAGSRRGLNNCMGSSGYYTRAVNGDSYCLVGMRNRDFVFAAELSQGKNDLWKIVQLNGYGNQSVPEGSELRAELLFMLNGAVEPKPEARANPVAAEGLIELIANFYPERHPVAPPLRDPVDIPPLEELGEDELNEHYIFGLEEEGNLVPRELPLVVYAERSQARRLRFAYPLSD